MTRPRTTTLHPTPGRRLQSILRQFKIRLGPRPKWRVGMMRIFHRS